MIGYNGGTAFGAAFDGSADTYLTVPDYASGLLHGKKFSVSLVMYMSAGYTGRWRSIFSKGARAQDRSPALFLRPVDTYMRAFMGSDGDDYCSLSGAYSCITKTAVRMKELRRYHLVFVVEDGQLSFYIDGVLKSQTGIPTLSCAPGAMCTTVDGIVRSCSSDRTGYGSIASDGSWYRIKPIDGCTDGAACACEPAVAANAVVKEGPLYIGSDFWNDGVAGYIKAFSVHAKPLDAAEVVALFLDDLPIFGCTDPNAFNYVEMANRDDGSCIAKEYGCIDTLAENFDPTANTDDGSCDLNPCTIGGRQPESCVAADFTVCSTLPYTANQTTCTNAGACTYTQPYSCTAIDGEACTTMDISSVDDVADQTACEGAGTCTYTAADSATSTAESCVATDLIACGGVAVDATESTCTSAGACRYVVPFSCAATNAHACAAANVSLARLLWSVEYSQTNSIDQATCEGTGDCVYTPLHPFAHNCHVNATCGHATPSNFTCTCNTGYVGSGEECELIYLGCNIVDSINYNPLANVDDGSCIPIVRGCTDDSADNYNAAANREYMPSTCYYNECLFGVFNSTSGRGHTCDGNATCVYNGTGVFSCDCNAVGDCDTGSCTGYIGNGTYCEVIVLGCLDATAFNFLPEANVDDGGCIPSVYGCLDSLATNYDPLVNRDDGSCDINPCLVGLDDCHEFAYCGHTGPSLHVCSCMPDYVGNGTFCVIPIYTCSYVVAVNYNPACALAVDACVEDGSCTFPIYGCMDSGADNWNMNANVDDGTCMRFGCMVAEAFNYVPDATIDDGSCLVYGCMDTAANNENSAANRPDNTQCTYTVLGCTYVDSLNYDATANSDDGSCIRIRRGCTHQDAENYDPLANVDDDTCIRIPCYQGTDDCHANATCAHLGPSSWECACVNNTVGNGTHCEPTVRGCMQPEAFNYNPAANADNSTSSSCIDVDAGCTDELAFNFDPVANTDNSSCVNRTYGCTDVRALNFNSTANVDDDSCEIDACEHSLHNCSTHAKCTYTPKHLDTVGVNCSIASTFSNLTNSSSSSLINCTNMSYTVSGAFSCACAPAFLGDGYACVPRLYGCTDAVALNLDALANTDDGSCIAVVEGCTNPVAQNFRLSANVDDGNCVIHPCNTTAKNYDSSTLGIIQ